MQARNTHHAGYTVDKGRLELSSTQNTLVLRLGDLRAARSITEAQISVNTPQGDEALPARPSSSPASGYW